MTLESYIIHIFKFIQYYIIKRQIIFKHYKFWSLYLIWKKLSIINQFPTIVYDINEYNQEHIT